ncbi:MAG: hypothetical protein R3F59_20240 [Myxococcota bacterium]
MADASGRAAYAVAGPDAQTVWVQAFVAAADGSVLATDVVERPVWPADRVWPGDATPADLAGYAAVSGALRLEGADDAALSLPDLVEVGGDVVLWEAPALREVALPALRWVGGDLALYDDPQVGGVDAPALERVGGSLTAYWMPGLRDLDGLASLAVIGGDLALYHDLALQRVDGPPLVRVGGGVQLWELEALEAVSWPALLGIGGRLDLFQDDALTALSAPALAELGGYELHHCDRMADVGRFDALRAVRGEVAVRYDAALTGLQGLGDVEAMGALSVQFSDALTTLSDLAALRELALGLEVVRCGGLTAVDLPALERAAVVSVRGNLALSEVGLPALQEAQTVGFADDPALPDCDVVALAERVGATAQCSGNLEDACTPSCAP